MNLEEKIMDSNALNESDCKTLVEDDDGMNAENNDNNFELPLEGDALNFTSGINGSTKMKLTKEIVKDCSHNRIEAKMDENKESNCCRKFGNELELKPIKSGFLDHIKSVIETKIENNNMWFKNQLDGLIVKIKESVNKSIVVTHRIDSNKEKEIGKGVGSQVKEYVTNHNF
ncbi:hypothetical protein C2G38_2201364 [Gigaspora rosea]|uniref:Uncharacterized protein n=1 Tax=Gigaspora rosea TaxID=44941 RepID=A0A397URF7_9GLOM|nr:hypothetical protein C2G38_2201364 [Gigaspora rosea]